MMSTPKAKSRREILRAVGAGAMLLMAPKVAFATAEQVADEAKKTFPGKTAIAGRIKLDLPTIAENGLVVPLNFEVESPMTDADYVKSVHFYAEGNPNPLIAGFQYTSMVPKAAGQIRIRLAQSQNIIAYAEMSDGKLYTVKKEVKVTIGGCGG